MGIHRKSPCQLRLEARSRAYHHDPPPPSSSNATSSSSGGQSCGRSQPPPAALLSSAQLAARLHSRIARAAEIRGLHRQRREASARERVQHARRVAREQDAKRRAQSASTRRRSRQKLEVARARRSAQLELLAQQCRARAELVLEKVESVRESQQRREARARQLIEHQLVDAAKRREAQTREMVQKLSARWHSVELVKGRVQRAKFIQRWYRRHVEVRRAAQQLRNAEQHVATVERGWHKLRDTNFEESMALLQQRAIAQAAQAVLRVLLPSADERGPSASPRSRSANFRVLLMAGMIAYHPKEIMSENYSSRLAFASRGVLRAMASIHEGFALELSSRELKACVATLEAKFAFYFESFTRWKERDAERLASELLASYHEIFQLKQHYEASAERALAGDGLHELNHQTERQLQQIRRALVQVVGKERAVERTGAIERQVLESRASSPASDDDDAMAGSIGQEPDEEAAEEEQRSSNDDEPAPQQHKQQRPALSDATSSSSSSSESTEEPPEQLVSLLNDRKLVHELILNPDLRVVDQQRHGEDAAAVMPVDASDVANLSRQVRTAMLRAFWDQVVALNDIPTLLARVDELRSLFYSTIGMRPNLVARVDDALRVDALHALMSDPVSNLMIIKARCDVVLDAILDAEAPARNEETRTFIQSLDTRARALASAANSNDTPIRLLVDFMAFAFEKVEQIRGDMVQTHVGMLGAYLQRHGVEYERKRVHAMLEAGELQLVKTQRWFEAEMETYWSQVDADERERLVRFNSDAFSRFYYSSVMALVVTHIESGLAPSSTQSGEWPEAFEVDVDHIRSVRDAIDRIAVISSLVAGVQDFLSRHQSVNVPREFFSQLKDQLIALLASPGISGASLVAQAVDAVARVNDDSGELDALRERLMASLSSGNPIFSLFFKRAAGAVQSRLLDEWRQAHPSGSRSGGSAEVHASLAPFAAEIGRTAHQLWKVAKLNEAVFATQYNVMIQRLVAARVDGKKQE